MKTDRDLLKRLQQRMVLVTGPEVILPADVVRALVADVTSLEKIDRRIDELSRVAVAAVDDTAYLPEDPL